MSLDHSKLVNLRRCSDGWTAQCPECARQGADQRGKNHLRIYLDGKYGCAVDRTPEHYKRIYALAGTIGSGEIIAGQVTSEEPIELPQTWPAELLDRLVHDYSYWTNRGIKEEVLVPLKGGLATAGQMARRFVLPIFGEDGEIVGFTGRALNPKMQIRWKHMVDVRSWVWGDLAMIGASVAGSATTRIFSSPPTP